MRVRETDKEKTKEKNKQSFETFEKKKWQRRKKCPIESICKVRVNYVNLFFNLIKKKVLQRKDPQIDAILDSATQVALYNWNTELNKWEKPDVEGTLFVYSRSSGEPKYGFTIMNRSVFFKRTNFEFYLLTLLD